MKKTIDFLRIYPVVRIRERTELWSNIYSNFKADK